MCVCVKLVVTNLRIVLKMKTKSAKAKGRDLQNYVRDWLRDRFWGEKLLEDDDIKAQTMGMTGLDIVLSPAARKLIPFGIECKNQKAPKIWAAYRQAKTNVTGTTLWPVAIVQGPKKERMVTVPLELFDLLIQQSLCVGPLPQNDIVRGKTNHEK